ncbi:MAG TPA: pyridoxal phosphate-dependent aminotransferase family protein [bacterium]|nr:pyridoxal phosphate-dependent aminotransferase family protein [bacterium]
MKIFDKCKRFVIARDIMNAGVYPFFREISSDIDTNVIINGKKTIMFGSNSYLALTNHPKVKEASINAIKKYGTGCAGSRFLNGTLDIHVELEDRLARLVKKKAALLFSTGYQTNLGVIACLLGPKDYCVMDKLNHSSLVAGAMLSHCKMLRYNHNDIQDASRIIEKNQINNGILITSDGVFSMDGDCANLEELVKLKEKHNAALLIDEAHGIGVFGEYGEGLVVERNLSDKVDLIMGTFSKSLASIGGFIAADEDIIHYLKHNSRAFIFSASMPPSSVASVLAALDIMKSEPERRHKLWDNTKYMHNGLKTLGFKTSGGETPILPIIVGEDMTAFKMCMELQEQGIFVNPAVSPAVLPGCALIRLSLMSSHTYQEIDYTLDKLKIVGKKYKLI